MGEALIYIGNSNSDGIPNTLLEAICMGVFPIQSNPGNATAEIIKHKENGLLIEDCENSEEVKQLILYALSIDNFKKRQHYNNTIIVKSIDYNIVKKNVNNIYLRF